MLCPSVGAVIRSAALAGLGAAPLMTGDGDATADGDGPALSAGEGEADGDGAGLVDSAAEGLVVATGAEVAAGATVGVAGAGAHAATLLKPIAHAARAAAWNKRRRVMEVSSRMR
jgi:hypothetical protein